MKKTYRDCFEFIQTANPWLTRHEEESKLKYALNKVIRKLNKVQEAYRELQEEINIEHCAVDSEGVILRDERGQYKYTKEGLIKRNKEVNKLFHENVEIEPHFVTDLPSDLTDIEKDVFTGFVLKEDKLEVVAA